MWACTDGDECVLSSLYFSEDTCPIAFKETSNKQLELLSFLSRIFVVIVILISENECLHES